ncbi:hypothetical protein JCM10908_005578 [Rhodotorula pacifica]|uniref:uncharacterized protein n=1 Tax=Rhodotorula pacifica TaxID=1495444 RepID=UPI00316F1397
MTPVADIPRFLAGVRKSLCGPRSQGIGYFDYYEPASFARLWDEVAALLAPWASCVPCASRNQARERAEHCYGPTYEGEPKHHYVQQLGTAQDIFHHLTRNLRVYDALIPKPPFELRELQALEHLVAQIDDPAHRRSRRPNILAFLRQAGRETIQRPSFVLLRERLELAVRNRHFPTVTQLRKDATAPAWIPRRPAAQQRTPTVAIEPAAVSSAEPALDTAPAAIAGDQEDWHTFFDFDGAAPPDPALARETRSLGTNPR